MNHMNYRPVRGKASPYKGASLQINLYDVFDVTRYLWMASELAGSPWVITIDETRPGPAGMDRRRSLTAARWPVH